MITIVMIQNCHPQRPFHLPIGTFLNFLSSANTGRIKRPPTTGVSARRTCLLETFALTPLSQSSFFTTDPQSVKYMRRKTSIMNQTRDVAIMILQIWNRRRFIRADCELTCIMERLRVRTNLLGRFGHHREIGIV